MLSEFNEALKKFRNDVCIKLRRFDTIPNFSSEKGKEIFRNQNKSLQLSEDIEYSSMILRDLFAEVIHDISNVGIAPIPLDHSIIVNGKFIVAFKSFMFFVRAYYDGLYATAVSFLDDEEKRNLEPRKGMMNLINEKEKSFKSENVITSKLESKIPDFVDWFLWIRELRNHIKTNSGGTNHTRGINCVTGAITVSFPLKSSNLDLRSATDILKKTTDITQFILEIGCEKCFSAT